MSRIRGGVGRLSTWVLALGFAAGSSACGGALKARSPSGWVEVRTQHFVVSTDLDDAMARHAARTLEETRAALLAAAWPEAKDPPGHTEFIVFARRGQMARFLPISASGVASRNQTFPSLIIYSPGGAQGVPDIVPHELAHDLSHWFMPVQPPWFAEGLACYLQSVRYDAGQATMGSWPREIFNALRRQSPASPTELLATTVVPHQPEENAAFYGGAWLFTQYLLNQEGARFSKFQAALGRLMDWRTAWSEQFGELEAGLDRDVAQRRVDYTEVTTKVPPITFEATSRSLSKAAVHGLFARASMVAGARDNEILLAETAAALRADPGEINALASSFYGMSQSLEALSELSRKAVAAHPESPLAWLMVADTAASVEERTQAIAAALRADPFSSGARLRSALLKVATGQARAALTDTRLAIKLGAPSFQLFQAHSAALSANGRCEDARLVQMNRVPGFSDAALLRLKNGLTPAELRCAEQLRR